MAFPPLQAGNRSVRISSAVQGDLFRMFVVFNRSAPVLKESLLVTPQ
jgi:hypothetical protein